MLFLSWLYMIAAVGGGTILVCQFLLSLFGLGHDGADFGHHMGDFHAGGDVHSGGGVHHGGATHATSDQHHTDSSRTFAVISFRTLVAASAFFGIVGLSTLNAGFPATTTIVLAIIAGVCAMYGMFGLLGLIASLGSAGNEQISNAVGLAATVYIPIPANGKGLGKVQLSMQNRIVEYQAVTADTEPLKTGEAVEVVAIKGDDTVEVCRANQPAKKLPANC